MAPSLSPDREALVPPTRPTLNQIRLWVIGFGLMALLGAVQAAGPGLGIRAQITESGQFSPPKQVTAVAQADAAVGHSGLMEDEPVLVSASRRVPAVQGTTFGFRYRILGLPLHRPVDLQIRVEHPPIVKADGQPSTLSRAVFPIESDDGTYENSLMYRLSQPGEVVPGNWTLEVRLQGQRLAGQTFVLE